MLSSPSPVPPPHHRKRVGPRLGKRRQGRQPIVKENISTVICLAVFHQAGMMLQDSVGPSVSKLTLKHRLTTRLLMSFRADSLDADEAERGGANSDGVQADWCPDRGRPQ